MNDLVTSIDERISAARAEISQLQSARAALLQTTGRQGKRAPLRRAARSGAASKSAPARPVTLSADQILGLLSAAGVSRSMLVTQTRASERQISNLLKNMEAQGQVRREGERKLTRWFPITDEDRVAARAAELEKQRSGNRRRTRKPAASTADPA